MALNLFSGDADLYVSFTVERPTAADGQHTWGARGRSSCLTVDCGNSIQNGDAIHIPQNDPRFCGGHMRPGDNCMAYVAVHGSLGVRHVTRDSPALSFSSLLSASPSSPLRLSSRCCSR